ncbi:MAG TPA: amidohydrolase family protein [Terriglobales bacterium]|nr:amidohydrolase family protein [Terriglobales bacterium]
MNLRLVAILVFLMKPAVGGALPVPNQDPELPTLAIVSATLVDVRTGKETPDTVILIRGERIEQVGPSDKITVPSQAVVVDAARKWVIPGLMDMHAHAGNPQEVPVNLYLAQGVTTIRSPGGNISLLRLLREQIDSGKTIGPRLFFSGPLLDGNPPVWPNDSFLVDTPERGQSAVNFLADQGVDFIKVYNNVSEPVLATIIETAKQRGLIVAGHIPRTMTMTRAVDLGMKSLEHIRVTGREILTVEEANRIDFLPLGQREPLLWEKFDPASPKFTELIRHLADKGIYLDPTLTIDEATFVLGSAAQHNNPNNSVLPPQWIEFEESHHSPLYDVPPALRETAGNGFKKRQQFVGMCSRAGVKIIAGTDGPGLGTLVPGYGLHHELQLLVESGLSADQALRAATLTAAEALGKDKDLGSVEAGKLADLLIVGADPLADIRNASKIEMVIKGGKQYRPADLIQNHH